MIMLKAFKNGHWTDLVGTDSDIAQAAQALGRISARLNDGRACVSLGLYADDIEISVARLKQHDIGITWHGVES